MTSYPSPAELALQFTRAKRSGWIAFFQNAGYAVEPELLMGIASRETNMQNILGDYDPITNEPNGYSIMQIDRRYFPDWCASGKWQDVREAIRMGAFVLQSKINRVTANGRVPADAVMQVSVAAYNAGDNAIDEYLTHGDPDLATTGHDYSKDVFARTVFFRSWVGNTIPDVGEPAVTKAVASQQSERASRPPTLFQRLLKSWV